jgi:hypothetical protein
MARATSGGPSFGRMHDDQGPVRRGERLYRRVQHFARSGTTQDILRLQILAARQRRVKIAHLLVVVPARRRQHIRHGGQRRFWRPQGILIGIQPHHVLGQIAFDHGALRVSHLRQHLSDGHGRADARGKSSSSDHRASSRTGLLAGRRRQAKRPVPQAKYTVVRLG